MSRKPTTLAAAAAFSITQLASAAFIDDNGAAQFFTADDNPNVTPEFSNPGPADGNVIWNSENNGGGDPSIDFGVEQITVAPVVSTATVVENAIVFDGSYVGFAGAYATGPIDASFELFVRKTDFAAGVGQVLFETGGASNGLSITIGAFSNGVPQVQSSTEQAGVVAAQLSSDVIDDFFQIVVVHDGTGGDYRLYINGALADSNASLAENEPVAGTNGAGIGGVNSAVNGGGLGTANFTGEIAAFRFYTSALSDAEVAASYVAAIPEPTSALLAFGGLGLLGMRRHRA